MTILVSKRVGDYFSRQALVRGPLGTGKDLPVDKKIANIKKNVTKFPFLQTIVNQLDANAAQLQEVPTFPRHFPDIFPTFS